jgi:AraC family transcriptional regulator, arabinose operon regulatory protein
VPEQNKDRRIVFAIRFLAKKYLHSKRVVEEIASVLHLSPSRFRHLFKQETGVPPALYLKHLRLRYARHLLEESTLSVKEVMAAVGINDFSHFVRDFKSMYRLTPSEARQLCLAARLSKFQGQQDQPTDSHSRQNNVIAVTGREVKLPTEPS